jgi:superkiller protein 3
MMTTTYTTQVAIHDALPVLEELVALLEEEEEQLLKKEIDKRRMRLGACDPVQLKKEVGCKIWGASLVRFIHVHLRILY